MWLDISRSLFDIDRICKATESIMTMTCCKSLSGRRKGKRNTHKQVSGTFQAPISTRMLYVTWLAGIQGHLSKIAAFYVYRWARLNNIAMRGFLSFHGPGLS